MMDAPAKFVPYNFQNVRQNSLNTYLNNYNANFNGQRIVINRGNTFPNWAPQNQYPSWYQPSPNWRYANGFTFGNQYYGPENIGYGWEPYFGQAPSGFICAPDYVPTEWTRTLGLRRLARQLCLAQCVVRNC